MGGGHGRPADTDGSEDQVRMQKEFPQRWRRVRGIAEYRQGRAELDNYRVQRLLGILPKQKGKATMETIPDAPDRSRFSCERYQFFLDAPFEIGQRCCKVMKKRPFERYERETGRKPMTGQMAEESRLRQQSWIKSGCNAFDNTHPKSNPMMFWTEQDVLRYILENDLKIAPIYGDIIRDAEVNGQMNLFDFGMGEDTDRLKTTGCNRTGCMFCGYGCHLEKPGEGRFERMKTTHPKQYEYIMKPWDQGGLGYKDVIDWINEHGDLHIRY